MVYLKVFGDNIGRYKFQIFATLVANLISVSFGAFIGWGSSAFLLFKSSVSPLDTGPLTTSQMSWAGSISCLGALFGNFFFGWMADRIGRRISLIIATIPSIIGWILLIVVSDTIYLFCGRFIGGIAGGASFVLVPLYSTEISEVRIRGTLGSCFIATNNLGTLIAFILSDYVAYNISPYIYICINVICLIGLLFLPESPIFLMKHQKEQEAENSLRFFRNQRSRVQMADDFKVELEALRKELLNKELNNKEQSLRLNDLCNSSTIRVSLLSLALMCFNQCSGCFAMINYAAEIFEESGSSMSPNQSAMIVGFIQLLGACTSVLLVERAGRKILLTTSLFGAAIAHTCLGTYSCLSSLGYQMESLKWIPIVSFSLLMLIASWGILTLPFLVISEISPHKIRSFVMSIGMVAAWVFAFLIVKFLPVLFEVLHLYGCVFIFGAVCFVGAVFVIIFIPETKGKSLEELAIIFAKKSAK